MRFRKTGAPKFAFAVSDNLLLLSVPPEQVALCDDCPDVHVLLLTNPSLENIQALAAGLAHLSDHCLSEKPERPQG